MRISNIFICFVITLSQTIFSQNDTNDQLNRVFPGEKWLTIKPEKVGFSSEKLEIAKEKFETSGGISTVIISRGYLIADWGETNKNFDCRSIRKSLINSVYGIYSEKGKLNIGMSLADININDKNKLTKNELETEIQYLLSSSSGIYLPAAFENKAYRNKPARNTFKPGEKFIYNNWDFNILSTIFNKLTNKDIFIAFDEHIAKPLQMEHFNVRYNTAYIYQQELSDHPAYIFMISTKDLARYGLLYLNEGNWKGEQLIPRNWILESTSQQIKTDKNNYYDYGYLWWVSKRSTENSRTPFLARGAQSQYMYLDPANDLIIIFRDNPESNIKVKKSIGYSLIGSVYGAMSR